LRCGSPPTDHRTAATRCHSYQEIRELAGGVSYTNVNRHLVRGRRRLRDLKQDAA
jgi:DNA-directed RNA polymerase specialized sigma24 family protein